MSQFEFLPLTDLREQKEEPAEFPDYAFPKELRDIADELHRTLNFPKEYFLTGALSAGATAIGNSCVIEAKRGFRMKAILYVAICGNPGVNKSAPLRASLAPFTMHDRRQMRDYKTQMADYEKLENKDDQPLPKLKKFIISNSTMEGIHRVHSENPRGLMMMQDELAGHLKSQNMYRKGNDEEQWLSNFDGGDIIIDRKLTGSLTVSNPNINIIGSIQPGVLKKLFTNSVENGLLDRFIIATTNEIPEVLFTEEEPSQETFDRYDEIITRIMEIPLEFDEFGEIAPHVYRFSPDAKAIFKEWFDNHTPIGNPIADGINAKIKTYCLRFSLIIQILKGAIKGNFITEIEKDTVNESIILCEYFKGTAMQMRADMELINPSETLSDEQINLIEKLPETFTTAEALTLSNWTKPKLYRLLKRKELFSDCGRGTWRKKDVL